MGTEGDGDGDDNTPSTRTETETLTGSYGQVFLLLERVLCGPALLLRPFPFDEVVWVDIFIEVFVVQELGVERERTLRDQGRGEDEGREHSEVDLEV